MFVVRLGVDGGEVRELWRAAVTPEEVGRDIRLRWAEEDDWGSFMGVVLAVVLVAVLYLMVEEIRTLKTQVKKLQDTCVVQERR